MRFRPEKMASILRMEALDLDLLFCEGFRMLWYSITVDPDLRCK